MSLIQERNGHFSLSVVDVSTHYASSVNPPITVYPGQTVKLTGMSQVVEDGILVCEEKLSSVVSTLTPSTNKAGQPSVLQNTTFSNASQHGQVQWGFNNNMNPATFAVWDPNITSYNLTMKGVGCESYVPGVQTVTFTLNVKQFTQADLSLNVTQSVCPSISYNATTNTAGLIGDNPFFSGKSGCSVVYQVTHAPYNAQFGFLQTVSSGAMGGVTTKDKINAMQTLFEETVTADCIKDARGNYKTITVVPSVTEGSNATLVFTSAPSIFPAPYYSAVCDTTLVPPVKSGAYAYYDLQYNTYLMMRVLGGDDAEWVPVRKAVWSLDTLKVSCNSTKACATGGVEPDGEGQIVYDNPLWTASGHVTPPAEDAGWLAKAVSPTWGNITAASYDCALEEGHLDQPSIIDFWFFCPATASSLGSEEALYQSIMQDVG